MRFLILLALSCSLAYSDPGAEWSEEEAKIVKAKLYAVIEQGMFTSKEYLKLYPEQKNQEGELVEMTKWAELMTLPGASKLVRLGFHQCLKYSDGTGGCNGCLNNHNLGLDKRHVCAEFDKADQNKFTESNQVQTDNAGLEHTADILEELFTNATFPSNAVPLEVSLADSGKSRADLWTFASAVAVQWGIERNNRGCDGDIYAGDDVK